MPEPKKNSINNKNKSRKCKQLKINNQLSEDPSFPEESKTMRKIRVLFNDPYATDSSSSEDEADKCSTRKRKCVVHEIMLPPVFPSPSSVKNEPESSSQDSSYGTKTATAKATTERKRGLNNPVGIRQRKWGKWAAEIRNPITKKRVWLGTYDCVEGAIDAYNAKKREFESLTVASTEKNHIVSASVTPSHSQISVSSSSDELESLLSHTSPSSIREQDTSASAEAKAKAKTSDLTAQSGFIIKNDSELNVCKDFVDEEGFNEIMAHLEIPDLGYTNDLLLPPPCEQVLNIEDPGYDLMFKDEYGESFNDDCGLNDISLNGIEGSDGGPISLPDYDFDDILFDLSDVKLFGNDLLHPSLNIACL